MATFYKQGSRGEVVKQIQKALNLYPDGIFGPLTKERVMQFQRENGLTVDGIVGPATLAKLIPCWLRKSKRRITEIIVHCTATQEGRHVTVDELRLWHKQKGWSDIGYHYVVYLDGTVHEGRNVDISGAHCTGHNANSIGVVYVGGVARDGKTDKDTRTDEQKAALLSLLMDLRKLYPDARIIGHRDLSPDKDGNGIIEPKEWLKKCPSFDARSEYRMI